MPVDGLAGRGLGWVGCWVGWARLKLVLGWAGLGWAGWLAGLAGLGWLAGWLAGKELDFDKGRKGKGIRVGRVRV